MCMRGVLHSISNVVILHIMINYLWMFMAWLSLQQMGHPLCPTWLLQRQMQVQYITTTLRWVPSPSWYRRTSLKSYAKRPIHHLIVGMYNTRLDEVNKLNGSTHVKPEIRQLPCLHMEWYSSWCQCSFVSRWLWSWGLCQYERSWPKAISSTNAINSVQIH